MLRTRPEQPRGACLALFLLGCVVQSTRALPQLDPVHTHMESPPPKVQRPHVRSPFARSVISPKRVTALVPAACVGLRFFAPALSTKIFFHLICFLGALFEPFEMVLPKRSLLLGFIHQMRDARNAYDDKHGIPRMQQQFFEEEEEEGGGWGALLRTALTPALTQRRRRLRRRRLRRRLRLTRALLTMRTTRSLLRTRAELKLRLSMVLVCTMQRRVGFSSPVLSSIYIWAFFTMVALLGTKQQHLLSSTLTLPKLRPPPSPFP